MGSTHAARTLTEPAVAVGGAGESAGGGVGGGDGGRGEGGAGASEGGERRQFCAFGLRRDASAVGGGTCVCMYESVFWRIFYFHIKQVTIKWVWLNVGLLLRDVRTST